MRSAISCRSLPVGSPRSDSSLWRKAGSCRCCHCSSHDLSMIAFQLGRWEKGWKVARHPRIKPVPRIEICATMLPPLAFSARICSSCCLNDRPLIGDSRAVKVTGAPVSRLRSPIHWNSFHSGSKSLAISNTPWPARLSARPIPRSSSLVAVVPGTSSPSMDLWRIVRDVENPTAPA